MAIAVAEIISQSKLISDKRLDASITDADWVIWTNRHIEALWRFMTPLDPALWFTQRDFTLAGGAAGASFEFLPYVLPSFRGLHGLDLNPDTTSRRTIPRRNFRERNIPAIAWWTPAEWARDRAYDIRGRKLVITPYESAAGLYRVYWRGAPLQFVTATDTERVITLAAGDLVGSDGTNATLTVAAGPFLSTDVGRMLDFAFTGANAVHNGRYQVRSFTSATVVVLTCPPLSPVYASPTPAGNTVTIVGNLDWQLEQYVEAIEILNARKALGQEESETGFQSERLAEIKQEIAEAYSRDDSEAAVIADVEDDIGDGWR